MSIERFPKWGVILASSLGVLLHMYISVFEASGGLSAFTVGLLAWALVPYVICLFIAFVRGGRPFLGFCGATAALLGDLSSYYSVFISPTSSTSAIVLLFAPMVSLVFWMPLGVLVGYVVCRLHIRRAAP